MKVRFFIPLIIFLMLAGLLYRGLGLNPRDIPSVLIDEKAPEFSMVDLFDTEKRVASAEMKGKVWLINFWGTWCPECWREHGFLNHLAKTEGVKIIGVNWRDDLEDARGFLKKKGNPFVAVGIDPESDIAIDWGVYAAPETFVIDKQGIIRKKHKGPLGEGIWQAEFKPLLEKLEVE